jgi:hypothetical protein
MEDITGDRGCKLAESKVASNIIYEDKVYEHLECLTSKARVNILLNMKYD